jgi:magnesium chelatase subunit D
VSARPEALPSRWEDALLAAALLAIDPDGLGGVHVRARAGVVRDRWLEAATHLASDGVPIRRIAAGIPEMRLTGGLDIGRTLELGRPVVERGVLASADGGLVILSMAERLESPAAAVIGMALDNRSVSIERDGISTIQAARFALIALDEGIDDERLAVPLADRLGLRVDLNAIGLHDMDGEPPSGSGVEEARVLLPSVAVSGELIEALCAVGLSAGLRSMRSSLHLVRAARAAAALRGNEVAGVADAATALRLVLGMQPATPQHDEPAPEQSAEPDPPPPADQKTQQLSAEDLRDMIVEAVSAVLPKHLLAGLGSAAPLGHQRGAAGKAGFVRSRARRGRSIGTSDKPPVPGARLDVLATLRQAAPWQRIRANVGGERRTEADRRLHIRKSDFRYPRLREKTGTTAIFAVDASGSAAIERLAETKGAVELLLAECYVRRDSVAMIAFRGKGSETLLEPTRSLVRAKRSLSALPGGGGTPLAGGIMAALAMAMNVRAKGQSVVTVFLTDGRGNVALDGSIAKDQVANDTAKAAARFRATGTRAIVIDTAKRPQARAEALARELGAEYLALPRGGSQQVAREIGARMGAEA